MNYSYIFNTTHCTNYETSSKDDFISEYVQQLIINCILQVSQCQTKFIGSYSFLEMY